MDKYEYNLRNEEINALIGKREFQKAVQIADTIDWTKVRSVKTLCKISDLYKVNRRYNEAKILLEQALNRCPNGKSIVSSLCELCIRMEDVVGAMEYYKLFIQMAPTDNIKFILLYKIYEAQEVTLDERIQVLEELKKRERIEKWCYELAYLYHRIGLTTKCVEECDDLILWFREGKYVKKAMELKMLHQQLTQSQDVLYQNMLNPQEREAHIDQTIVHETVTETIPVVPEDLVKTVDVGQYSTINIQKALEESIKDTLGDNPVFESGDLVENAEDSTVYLRDPAEEENDVSEEIGKTDKVAQAILAPMMQDTGEMQELFFEANNTGEIELEEPVESEITVNEEENAIEGNDESIEQSSEEVTEEANLVAFPDVPVSEDTIVYNKGDITNQVRQAVFAETSSNESVNPGEEAEAVPVINLDTATKEELMELIDRKVTEALENAMKGQPMIQAAAKEPVVVRKKPIEDLVDVAPPRSMQKMLSQDYDGQISFVVPEQEQIEKQITGQMNIEEYLTEWENTKKQQQHKSEEQIKKRLEQATGNLFSDFEAKARDSILEQLNSEDDNSPIDADKAYEEYIKKITEEDDQQSTNNQKEVVSESVEEFPEVEELVDEPESVDIPEEEIQKNSMGGIIEESEKGDDVADAVDTTIDEAMEEETDSLSEEEEKTVEEEEQTVEEEEQESEDDIDNLNVPDGEITDSSFIEEDEEVEVERVSSTADSEDDGDSRPLTEEELSLFSQFIQTKKAKQNLSKALDSISLASYTGNVFVTGESGEDTVELARSVVQYARSADGNFSGKVGKVSGNSLNGKDISSTIEKMKNGGLIIEKAGDMKADTVKNLIKILNQDNLGVLIVMQDTKKEMNKMFSHFEGMRSIFNVHIEIEELSDDALVAYGRQYAEHMEYTIDEMGILALHTRIDEMQTSDHVVTVADVRDIVDDAIEHATRFSPKHIADILFGRRYDDEDMIILKERDF